MRTTLKMLEEKTFFTDDSSVLPPDDIVAYNELRSCADLYRMYKQGILKIQPEFQREFVWKGPDQSRFIDSLVKQLPIPSMCVSYDPDKQEWMVIDGLQRISTIVKFLQGGDWQISRLEDIDQNISGKSVAAIKTSEGELHKYYSRVENLTIPITVLRCDHGKKSHLEYLFTIFHRLNTGGMKLNNQEIRNCIYGGTFNRLLKQLDQFPTWRKINKMQPGNEYRYLKQEQILRFFAFSERLEKYNGKLSKYLNEYMADNRYIDRQKSEAMSSVFERVCNIIYDKVFIGNAPKKISITVLESLMLGIEANINNLEDFEAIKMRELYILMTRDEEFSEASLKEGLSKRKKVLDRIKKAKEIFAINGQ